MGDCEAIVESGRLAKARNERSIKKVIEQVDALHEQSAAGEAIAPDELQEIKAALVETQGIVRQAELSSYGNTTSDTNAKRREELEDRLESLQREYEEVLERNLSEVDVEEVKSKTDAKFAVAADLKSME